MFGIAISNHQCHLEIKDIAELDHRNTRPTCHLTVISLLCVVIMVVDGMESSIRQQTADY